MGGYARACPAKKAVMPRAVAPQENIGSTADTLQSSAAWANTPYCMDSGMLKTLQEYTDAIEAEMVKIGGAASLSVFARYHRERSQHLADREDIARAHSVFGRTTPTLPHEHSR